MRNITFTSLLIGLVLTLSACQPARLEPTPKPMTPVEPQAAETQSPRESPPPPTKTRVPPARDVPPEPRQEVQLVEYELTPPRIAGEPAVLTVRGTAILDCPPMEVLVGEPDLKGRIEIMLPALTKGCENQPRDYKLRVELGPYAAGEYSLWADGEEVAAWTQP